SSLFQCKTQTLSEADKEMMCLTLL
ncbi:hypothetical protein ACMD2_22333, partial [Ananas comosus]